MTKNYITCPKCGTKIPVTTGVVNRLGRKSYDIDFPIVCKAVQVCRGNYSAAARFITEKTGQRVTPGFVQNRIQRAGKTKEEILGKQEKEEREREEEARWRMEDQHRSERTKAEDVKMKSQRRSMRPKAGMERARGESKHLDRPRKTFKPITLKEICSTSIDVKGRRFYAVRYDPPMHPTWVKFGITRDLRRRFSDYTLSHPNCELMGSWRSTKEWEKLAISHVIKELRGTLASNMAREFFEINKWAEVVPILSNWFFLRQFQFSNISNKRAGKTKEEILKKGKENVL